MTVGTVDFVGKSALQVAAEQFSGMTSTLKRLGLFGQLRAYTRRRGPQPLFESVKQMVRCITLVLDNPPEQEQNHNDAR